MIGSKGSLKNNLAFSHPVFRPSLSDPQSQNPRNSPLLRWFCNFRSNKSDLNPGANSVKLFLRKPLVPIHQNRVMFAHDLCHSQIEYLSLRLVDPTARRGILSILIKKTERSDTTNRQYSIVNIQFFRLVRVRYLYRTSLFPYNALQTPVPDKASPNN